MTKMLRIFAKLLFELFIVVIVSLLFARLAFAQVIISEVMPAPTQSNEWVELKNVSQAEVDISGWSVEDANGLLQPSPSFSGAIISPGSFFIFELVNKLNNTGDSITLKNAVAEVVDHVTYSSSSATHSWSRRSGVDSSLVFSVPSKGAENVLPSPIPSPSPFPSPSPHPANSPLPSTSPTFTPSPTPLPVHSHSPVPFPSTTPTPTLIPLRLSEIVACPESAAKEWVEFFNPNVDTISLTGWKLKDSSGNSRNLELELPAQGYVLFELSTGIFNNEGDTLLIFNEHGQELIEVELPACTKGESTIFTTKGWQQTLEPTPLQPNIFAGSSLDNEPLTYRLEPSEAVSAELSFPTNGQKADSSIPLYKNDPLLQMPDIEDLLVSNDDLATTQASLYTLPQLVASSPSPTETTAQPALPDEAQLVSSTRIPRRSWLAALFACSIALLGTSGYCFYQWYTERYVNTAMEAF